MVRILMTDPVILNHDASVMQAIEVASDFVGEAIPVVRTVMTMKFIGVVSEGTYLSGLSWQLKTGYAILEHG